MTSLDMTAERVKDIRDRSAALRAWLNENKTNAYKRGELPAYLNPPTNEELGAAEVWEWINDIPLTYFLYVNEKNKTATNWMGDKLGDVQFGREWRDNFGGVRVPITVHGTNGANYHGTYYKSSGDYARIKRAKNG